MTEPWWMWAVFGAIVLALIAIDLGLFNKKARVMSIRESLYLSGGYITIGLLFGLFIWYRMGLQSAELYWTGFFVEKTLSLDNIFVISLIFGYFAIPREHQHRVLFWGILGVIVLRGIMIALGAALISEFHAVLYIFSAFLIYTGIRMLFAKPDAEHDISQNPVLKFIRAHVPVTPTLHGQHFFVKEPDPATGKMKLFITPLFLALIVIECIDLIFAIDSIPAIFALTTDPYIVYTSNIFAILGLRALYFALEAVVHRFEYLKYALALVLVFIGSKMFLADIFGLNKFPPAVSLGVTVGLIAGGILFSLFKTHKQAHN